MSSCMSRNLACQVFPIYPHSNYPDHSLSPALALTIFAFVHWTADFLLSLIADHCSQLLDHLCSLLRLILSRCVSPLLQLLLVLEARVLWHTHLTLHTVTHSAPLVLGENNLPVDNDDECEKDGKKDDGHGVPYGHRGCHRSSGHQLVATGLGGKLVGGARQWRRRALCRATLCHPATARYKHRLYNQRASASTSFLMWSSDRLKAYTDSMNMDKGKTQER